MICFIFIFLQNGNISDAPSANETRTSLIPWPVEARRQDFFRKFQPGLAHFFLASGETGQEEFVKRKQKQTLFRNFI